MKFVSFLVLLSLISNSAFATCDFSKGIKPLADGTYAYTKICHVAVGQMKDDLSIAQKQVADDKKAIDLKDLAIKKTEDRANLWMDTSGKLEDRVTKIDELESRNYWLYFGLGVITTFAAGYLAAQAFRH